MLVLSIVKKTSHGSWTLTTLELGLAPGNGGEEDNVDVERTQLVVQLLQQATYAFEGWVPGFGKIQVSISLADSSRLYEGFIYYHYPLLATINHY